MFLLVKEFLAFTDSLAISLYLRAAVKCKQNCLFVLFESRNVRNIDVQKRYIALHRHTTQGTIEQKALFSVHAKNIV